MSESGDESGDKSSDESGRFPKQQRRTGATRFDVTTAVYALWEVKAAVITIRSGGKVVGEKERGGGGGSSSRCLRAFGVIRGTLTQYMDS